MTQAYGVIQWNYKAMKGTNLMKDDYKQNYKDLCREIRWFVEYHRTMADHYREYKKPHLEELHETAWSEFYLLMDKFNIEDNE